MADILLDPPYSKTPCGTQTSWLYYRSEVRPIIEIFALFGSYDLDLDPMTFIYELDPYRLEIYRMCKNELHASTLSTIIV